MPNSKELSPFGQTALGLDGDFADLERLSGQIERLDIESDNGLEQAQQLMGRFAECGQRIAEGVQALAKHLDEARLRAEKSAQLVANRAAQVQQRQQDGERLFSRFQSLSNTVRQATQDLVQFKKPAGETLSNEEKVRLETQLSSLDTQLGSLVDEAAAIRSDAGSSNMRGLERNADSLAQSLEAARRKLGSFATGA